MGLRAADKERLAPGLGSGQADVLGVGLPGGGTLGCSVGFRLLPSGAWELTGRWHAMQQDLVQISAAHVGPGNAVLARALHPDPPSPPPGGVQERTTMTYNRRSFALRGATEALLALHAGSGGRVTLWVEGSDAAHVCVLQSKGRNRRLTHVKALCGALGGVEEKQRVRVYHAGGGRLHASPLTPT